MSAVGEPICTASKIEFKYPRSHLVVHLGPPAHLCDHALLPMTRRCHDEATCNNRRLVDRNEHGAVDIHRYRGAALSISLAGPSHDLTDRDGAASRLAQIAAPRRCTSPP